MIPFIFLLPQIDVDFIWVYLFEGDFLGAFQAIIGGAFSSVSIGIAVLSLLFIVPIYIRTNSLLVVCILWILLGGFIITTIPLASGLALLFFSLGVAGLLWRLFRPV